MSLDLEISTIFITSSTSSSLTGTSGSLTSTEGTTTSHTSGFESTTSSNKSSILQSHSFIIGISVSLIGLFFLLLIVLIIFSKKNKKKFLQNSSHLEPPNSVELTTIQEVIKQDKLGGGNFGEVYKGLWKGASVAMKKLKNQEQYDEFIKEAGVLKSLNHPNIVQYMGIFIDDEDKYIITEVYSEKI